MSAYINDLSGLYQRVVQIELQLPATIDEVGYVFFEHPELGDIFISLLDPMPQVMRMECVIGRDHVHTLEDLTRICNDLNLSPYSGMLTVSDGFVVSASVEWFLAAPGMMPDEALLRAVIGQAISSIKEAIVDFEDELEKLDGAITSEQ